MIIASILPQLRVITIELISQLWRYN